MLASNEVLMVEHLSVAFPGRKVLRDVQFRLGTSEFCGLIGANGSGKTTLLRTILGLQAPSTGVVRIGSAGSIGYVPQKIMLDPFLPLRARDLVALGLDGGRFGLPLPSRRRATQVDAMLQAVDAVPFAEQRVGELSGGQQQRVLIAHALVRRPALLLLDEPLANLDISSAASIVSLLRRLSAEQQITILLSAHDMNPLLSAMDRVVYLANGRAASGPTAEVINSEVLSGLYECQVDVIRAQGRVLVVAAESSDA